MEKRVLILTKNDTFFNFIKESLLEVFEENTISIHRDIKRYSNIYIYIYIDAELVDIHATFLKNTLFSKKIYIITEQTSHIYKDLTNQNNLILPMPINKKAMHIFCQYLKFDFYENQKSNITIQNCILQIDKEEFVFQNRKIALTKKEFCFLRYIFINANTIISYSTLDEIFWSSNANTSGRRSFLCRLRSKIPYLQLTIKRDVGLGIFEKNFS